MPERLNEDIAGRLNEVARLLAAQGAGTFRVRAYHRAAETLRQLPRPVSEILEHEGLEGLRALPGIGLVLADQLHHDLGLDTLEDLEAAAHDGRLEQIVGLGPKRLAGIRDSLAHRLSPLRQPDAAAPGAPPSIAEILDVDREYREKAATGALVTIAPRRFNPSKQAWLPILHTERGGRHYTALFSNTARAHRLGRTRDWVVIYGDDGRGERQYTVITAERGPLASRRIVRGREAEQLPAPQTAAS